jgi:type I restriction enzyme S subunit
VVAPVDWKEVSFDEAFARVNISSRKLETSEFMDFGKLPVVDQGQSKISGFSDRIDLEMVPPQDGFIIFGDHTRIVKHVGHSFVVGADGVQVLRSRDGFNARFLTLLLSSSKIPNTGYNRHFKFLRDLIFRCPSSQVEQETIAEALSDADAAIESLEALIAKKRDVKQATMQQLLTGRTRLPGFTADWKEVRLGEHAAFFKGNGLSKSQLIDDGPQQCVHYGELFTHYGPVIENVTSKCVAFEGSFKSLAGDVLMPGSDVTPRGLATASAIKVSDVVLGGDVIVIRTKPTSLYGPFLSNFIRMSKGRVLRLVKGSTVYHIHAKDLADLEVLMPPLKEQEAIAETLSVMDDELAALTEQVLKMRMMKEGMMQDLLTGKVRLV